MAACNRFEGCLQIGEGLDTIELGGFDQQCDAAPSSTVFIVAGEQHILAIESNRASSSAQPFFQV
jgi:hypothetical protein